MSISLRSLSDREILSRICELTRRERSLTLSVLLHLNEIERRKLCLKQGYASMFDYCTTGLGYSASASARRIRTARCVARHQFVHALLESNQVNLSTVSQVSRILTPDNAEVVLKRICGKSQREVEAIVAEYQPRAVLRDIVRTVVLQVPPVEAGPTAAGQAVASRTPEPAGSASTLHDACEKSAYCRSGSAPDPQAVSSVNARGSGGAAKLERRALIQFSASESFMAKLEKVRSLAWHRLPANASLEQVFELALDSLIEHEDPSVRRERRATRPASKQALNTANASPAATHDSRRIPAAVRDEVHARDHGRCTFTGPTGRRCGSTRAVQIDHIVPVARGGGPTLGNLRLLCAYHNRLEAQRILGTATPPPRPGPGSSRATPA